jgi:hypothetical protein
MPSQDDLSALQKTYYAAYNALRDAYWAASTIEAKDEIHGAEDLVNQILDALDRADLESDNAAIADLTKSLKDSMNDLSKLQNKLDGIVHNVSIANTAVQAITAALTVAAKIVDAA